MIKNEEKIIERCMLSAIPILDAICVSDTGSTDNTINKVQELTTNKNIPCKIYNNEWKNFEHNRNLSFINTVEFCKELGWDLNETYGLLLDADMQLVPKNFNKEILINDGYKLIQESTSLEYANIRIIKLGYKWTCVGVTHEYWNGPNTDLIDKQLIFINDIGDGGSKQDKFDRDIKLLEAGIKNEPTNSRYHFYLAQSYKNVGRNKDAIDMYQKRMALGGWDQETWYCYYMIALCWLNLNDEDNMECWVNKAYKFKKDRLEPIYLLIKYFREKEQYHKACHYYKIGKTISYPKNNILFIEKNIYGKLFDYEREFFEKFSLIRRID